MRRTLPVALLLVAGLAGCSRGYDVDAFPTEPGTKVDCGALYADSPLVVDGQRVIDVADDTAVAWGAPPIILRCGVEKPAALTDASQCFDVDGIDWFAETTADGYLFTTIGRRFFVSVEVPKEYDPAADALVDLADTVRKHDLPVKPCRRAS